VILEDIYNFLTADSALRAALQADEGDNKIYPNYARISSRAPYIVYRSTNPGGTADEVLGQEAVSFTVTAEDFAQTVHISRLLGDLLDLKQIPSPAHNIYYAKKIGGNDFADELGRHARALNFIFKFNKKEI